MTLWTKIRDFLLAVHCRTCSSEGIVIRKDGRTETAIYCPRCGGDKAGQPVPE